MACNFLWHDLIVVMPRGPVNELGVRARQLRDCPPVKAAPCLGACSGSSGLVLQVIDR